MRLGSVEDNLLKKRLAKNAVGIRQATPPKRAAIEADIPAEDHRREMAKTTTICTPIRR